LQDVAETADIHDLDAPAERLRTLRIEFVTATELKMHGRLAERPEFGVLLARARDRMSELSALYGDGPLPLDFSAIGERAAAVAMPSCEIQHIAAERFSTRTGQSHALNGFTGWAEYEGNLGEFIPLLRAAQCTGVGRQTTWGKGEIRVQLPNQGG
jgi:CRISPR/Cas system endoribonuclease Cas6 (RAMP superfamily)